MNLVDSHCHLDSSEFDDDRDYQLSLARDKGICKWILPATGPDNWPVINKLCQTQDNLYAALGIHPWFVEDFAIGSIDQIIQIHSNNPDIVIAIGETGLDRLKANINKQKTYFERHLKLARQLNLPVIIHSVKAHDLTLACWKKFPGLTGVVHGFSGSIQQAEQFIAQGLLIGLGGVITYDRASKTRSAASSLPLQSLLIETDAPSMPLHGFQGSKNQPVQLRLIYETLCQLRKETPEQVAKQLWQNSHRLFRLNDRM